MIHARKKLHTNFFFFSFHSQFFYHRFFRLSPLFFDLTRPLEKPHTNSGSSRIAQALFSHLSEADPHVTFSPFFQYKIQYKISEEVSEKGVPHYKRVYTGDSVGLQFQY